MSNGTNPTNGRNKLTGWPLFLFETMRTFGVPTVILGAILLMIWTAQKQVVPVLISVMRR